KRGQVAGGEFLTLTLDGRMGPWDEVPFKDLEEKPGEVDALVKKLKGLQMVVSLGVRDNYVLLSARPSPDDLAKPGQGSRLADRPEFKPLAQFAGRRLTSISYGSRLLNEQVTTSARDVDRFTAWLGESLPRDKLTAAQREKVQKDLKAMGE